MRRIATLIIGLSAMLPLFIWQFQPNIVQDCRTKERLQYRYSENVPGRAFRPNTGRICNSLIFGTQGATRTSLGWGAGVKSTNDHQPIRVK